MGIQAGKTSTKATQPTEGLLAEIRSYISVLTRVEIRHRRSHAAGRMGGKPFSFVIESEDERDSDKIFDEIIKHCEEREEKDGWEYTWQAELMIMPKGETVSSAAKITFRLNEGDGVGSSEVTQIIALQGRSLRTLDLAYSRALGQVDKMVARQVELAHQYSEILKNNAEAKRIEYEHEERMAATASEDRKDEQELNLVVDLGTKALAIAAAREARTVETKAGEDPQIAWKKVRTIAQRIRNRPAVRELLGEEGSDLLDSMAAVKNLEQAQAIAEGFAKLQKDQKINFFEVVKVAPELLPVLDLLVH